ncbi:hypothetical protein G7Y79_00001g003870 [Physcia stellaris]|nr:hypothetical protein G7Y79_00001g003870 [Physcia stellaris]
MESRPLQKQDTRRHPEPVRKGSETDVQREGPMKTAIAGIFSENSTPRVAMTPADSEVPSLPGNASDSTKHLARMLNVYTKSIINTTQSMSQHKTAKARLRRSRKDDEKWQSRYSDFAALEEMQSKNLVASERKSSKSEKALEAAKKSHKLATAHVAISVTQNATSASSRASELANTKLPDMEIGSSSLERVKADLTRLRGDFRKLEDTHKVKRAVDQPDSKVEQIQLLEKDIERLGLDLDDFQIWIPPRLIKVEDGLAALEARLKQQIEDVSTKYVKMSTFRAYEQNAASLIVATSKVEAFMDEQGKRVMSEEEVDTSINNTALAARIDSLQDKVRLLETTDFDKRILTLEKISETSTESNAAQANLYDKAVEKNRTDLNEVKDRMVDSEKFEATREKNDKQVSDIKETLFKQSEDLREVKEDLRGFKEAIFGDSSGEPSLSDMINGCQTDGKKLRKAVETLDSTMDSYDSGFARIEDQIKTIEDKLTSVRFEPSNDNRGGETEADINQLKADVAVLIEEQEQKDDIVSQQIDRVDNEVIRHDDLLKILSDKVDNVQPRNASEEASLRDHLMQQTTERFGQIDEKLTQQENSISNIAKEVSMLNDKVKELPSDGPSTQQPPDALQRIHELLAQHRNTVEDLSTKMEGLRSQTDAERSATHSPHLTNGTVAKGMDSHKIENLENEHQLIKQEVHGLNSNFERFRESTTDTTTSHEFFLESLRQRFDNLTTDNMIGHMVRRLESMYPGLPAHVNSQLQGFYQRQIHAERQLVDVQKLLGVLNEQFSKLDQKTENNRQQIISRATEYSNLVGKTNQEREDLSQRIKVVSDDALDKISVVEQDGHDHLNRIQLLQKLHQSLRTEHTESVAELRAAVKAVQNIVEKAGVDNSSGAHDTDMVQIKPTVEGIQKRMDDVWDTFIKEMSATHSSLAAVRKNVEALNHACGIEGNVSPPPPTRAPPPSRRTNPTTPTPPSRPPNSSM